MIGKPVALILSKDSGLPIAATKFRALPLCPLTALDETAPETSVLQIPSSEAIQNHSTGAENGTRLSSSKDHRGRSGGRSAVILAIVRIRGGSHFRQKRVL